MLAAPGLSSYGFAYDNWAAAPVNTLGGAVTPGASNAEGSWTQVASSANIASATYWLYLSVNAGSSSANQKDHLVDIGIDTAGGSSYTAFVSNIVCGESGQILDAGGGHSFLFPIFIPAGSSVAVRIQGSNATAGTVNIGVKFFGDPSMPEAVPVGQFSETIGTITNSQGVSFTPGNGADGSWTSLGTTVQDLWWWQLCAQCSNGTITGVRTYVELAWGDATNKLILQKQMFLGTTLEICTDALKQNLIFMNAYQPIPGGSTLYVRGRCNTAPNTGWNAVAIGIGG